MKSCRVLGCLLVLTLAAGGCAHDGRLSARGSRTLIGVGTLVAVSGALVATGCTIDSGDRDASGCSGDPDDADLAVGLPILVAGSAMIATGIALRPQATAPLAAGPRQRPPQVLPDPFVKPLPTP